MKPKFGTKDKALFVVAVILVLISFVRVGIETYESLFYKPSNALKPFTVTKFFEQAEAVSSALNICREVGETNDI